MLLREIVASLTGAVFLLCICCSVAVADKPSPIKDSILILKKDLDLVSGKGKLENSSTAPDAVVCEMNDVQGEDIFLRKGTLLKAESAKVEKTRYHSNEKTPGRKDSQEKNESYQQWTEIHVTALQSNYKFVIKCHKNFRTWEESSLTYWDEECEVVREGTHGAHKLECHYTVPNYRPVTMVSSDWVKKDELNIFFDFIH